MESGILSELKHKQQRTTQQKTWVFASCISTDKLLPPLLTGFRDIHFKPYTEEEFVEIVVNVLAREEDVEKHKIKEIVNDKNSQSKPKVTEKEVKLTRVDIAIGIAFSHFIMWAIMLTTAGSLYDNGVTDIQSADQATKALEPLGKSFPNAGQISEAIFALG
jgi:hypothetical protein